MANEPEETEEVRRVVDTIDSLEAIEDPADRARRAASLLKAWPKQHSRLREIRQQAVIALREQKLSYRKIGELIDVHFTRVKEIEQGVTTSPRKTKKTTTPEE